MKCSEKVLKEILLKNGFKQTDYEVFGEIREEYVPTDDVVILIINEATTVRISKQDAKIRIEDNELTFLSGYQDYYGGWFTNETTIAVNSIKKLKIQKYNF